jgi:hypothetical protein
MVDFRSDPSESVEGKGIARRAWDAYARGVDRATRPLDPVKTAWARKLTEELVGFWVLWHALGGFEGLERYGMHKATIWRKVKKFRMILGQHPDEYKFVGITVDPPKLWDAMAAERAASQRARK